MPEKNRGRRQEVRGRKPDWWLVVGKMFNRNVGYSDPLLDWRQSLRFLFGISV